ncbi:MAG: hypothetical protein LKE86_08680 [Eubacterium sp.]|nr:hypothetical protein [Eubacterium sp.]MCH4047481.1 hypothetical protein [Eubacterium sp.]MCI1457426.1 hypothetical protein [Eubacterium sp.]MCI1520494.1 hypothetical protein [Eubacterium sp.]
MKSVIPTMLMIIGIAIMTATAVCFLSFQMQVSAAENVHAECMTKLQAARCSPQAAAQCQKRAAILGKESHLEVIPEGSHDSALVRLTYYADMPIFQLSRRGVIQGSIHV